MDYRNILIIQTAFIGDAILASSLLEKLHHRFPESSISILVRKGNESIYKDHPFLKNVLVWDKSRGKFKNLLNLLFEIRKKRFDCVINCHRYTSSGLLTAFSGAKHSAGFKQNPFSFLFNRSVPHRLQKGLHEIERYNQLVSDFAGEDLFKPKLYPGESDALAVKSLTDGKFVCIAPASVWFTKQLPKSKWIELCRSFSSDISVYILGAESDNDLAKEIIEQSGRSGMLNLCGKLSLLQSCSLMNKAVMNYVNDSAPLHLASSMDSPVKAFFLSTHVDFGFGPLSGRSAVIEVKGLPCRPCGLHGFKACPKGHFRCGLDMDMNEARLP
ncbi:MAG TPA: glycosyltransferase family 9 protein [Bacteroidia bacterium]|nr:glycosyltransferase family 9 protein [Bacteroidia bacterium]